MAVEVPALERRGALGRAEELRAEHGGVAHDIEHHPVAIGLVEHVHRVEHVTGLDVVPYDVGGVAVAWQQADPGVVPLLPAVREARTGGDGLHAEGHRKVEQHDVALRDGGVVHAHRAAHRDAPRGAHPRRRVDDRHLDVVAPAEEVGDGVELAGQRVPLGVRRVAALESAAEVARADRLELVGQLVGPCAGLDDGEGASRVPDHIRVRREVHLGVHGAGPRRLPQRARHLGGPDPAIAVPLGPAVAQPDAVHHPVAREPVVGRRLGHGDGIGAVAQVAAIESLGHPAGHRQLGRRHLLVHGSESAL